MLMKSDINPFDSQETKPYKSDPRIAAMTELVDAYQRDDIYKYENVLQKNKDLLSDQFIAENIDEVTRNMRTKAVLKLIVPYTRMRLGWIARHLRIGEPEVQDIVSYLIVDGRVSGHIDEHTGIFEIESRGDTDRIKAIQVLSNAIGDLAATILKDNEAFRPPTETNSSYTDQLGEGNTFSDAPRPGNRSARTRRGRGGFLSMAMH
jgi:COP9 signalosome complex subunit 2